MGELTEARVRAIVNEELEAAKAALKAAKPRLKGPPSFLSRRSKKSNTQETKPKS